MKKQLLFIPLLAGFFMSAKADITVHDVAGTYVGKLDVYFENTYDGPLVLELVSSKENVEVVTEVVENKLLFKLTDFDIMGIPVGDIEVENVEVDNLGNIIPTTSIVDKSTIGLGKLPTTLTGTLLRTDANLNIRVLWDALGGMPEEGSETTQPIQVLYAGEKAVPASLENTVKDFYISNAGNSITVVGAALNKFSVFNVQGKLVSASSNVVGNTIDFSSLNDGVYIVKIETANGSLVKKIIKK